MMRTRRASWEKMEEERRSTGRRRMCGFHHRNIRKSARRCRRRVYRDTHRSGRVSAQPLAHVPFFQLTRYNGDWSLALSHQLPQITFGIPRAAMGEHKTFPRADEKERLYRFRRA